MTVTPAARGGPIIWPLAAKLNRPFAAQQRPNWTGGLAAPKRPVNLPWNGVGPFLLDTPSEPRVVHQLLPLVGWAIPASATLAVTEADDTVVSTAQLALAAALAVTEADDTVASVATITLRAVLAITESDDSLISATTLALRATLAVTEADDTLAATAILALAATLALTEADDTLLSAAALALKAALAVTEGDDTLASTATIHDFVASHPKRHWTPFLEPIGRLKS